MKHNTLNRRLFDLFKTRNSNNLCYSESIVCGGFQFDNFLLVLPQ